MLQSFSSRQHGSRRWRQALQQKTLPSWAQAGFANVNNERKWASEVTSCWPQPGIDTSVYTQHTQQHELFPQGYTTMVPQPASLVGHNGHYASMPVLQPAKCDPVPGCWYMLGQSGSLLTLPGNGGVATAYGPDPSPTTSFMQMQHRGGKGGRGRRGGSRSTIIIWISQKVPYTQTRYQIA